MKTLLKRITDSYIALGIIALLVGLLIGKIASPPKTAEALVKVTRGTITREVIVTGKTVPVEQVNLAFERSGTIAHIYAPLGAIVRRGQLLAEENSAELSANLLEAQANLEVQQAKLAEAARGTRPEEILVEEVKVANAKTALEDTKQNVVDTIEDALTKSDDAVRNRVDQLFSNPHTDPRLIFIDFQNRMDAERDRAFVEYALATWRQSISALTPSAELAPHIQTAKAKLSLIKSFVNLIAEGVNAMTTAQSSTYRADLSIARTNLNTAIANISATDGALRSAESALLLAEQSLVLKRAGNTPESITAQEAMVKQMQASVRAAEAQLAKTTLRAPIAGTITTQDAKVGQIVAANASVISIFSNDNLEIEANIPEIDIGSITVGNSVRFTLDAFPGEPFAGKVAFIDPAETIVEGISNFNIKVRFDAPDPRMKSGLTANLSIETQKREGVLIVPQSAVFETAEGAIVRRKKDQTFVATKVTTGLRGQDGTIEIISGLEEGDIIENVGGKK